MSQFNNAFHEIRVDGELVIVPSHEEWQEILQTTTYCGVFVFGSEMSNIVNFLYLFVSKYPERFCLGLRRIKNFKDWLPMPLLRVGDDWQRVQIERVHCDKCTWYGQIANPTEPSLYFGVPNELAVFQKASLLPRCNCPQCGTPLPRTAIWVET